MTPAVAAAKKAGIPFRLHEYEHDPAAASYGEEAASKLGISADRVFKTLLAETEAGQLVVGVVPVATQLNLKALATALGAKRAVMADVSAAERATGYVAGGISPLGQKRRLRMAIDERVKLFETVFVSAGRRGLEIELAPADLIRLTGATVAPIGREQER